MKQKYWLKDNMGEYKTMAGFLDKIINDYKNEHSKKIEVQER